jgi:hypothetical protein
MSSAGGTVSLRASISLVRFGGPLSQLFRVAEVLRATGLLLVAEQCRTTDKVRGDPV